MTLCPYCGIRARTSDEHVFPDFLGGRTTIRVCKECNDLLGHSVEGPASADLAPIVVMLRTAGLRSPRMVVWKRAFRDENGIEYDVDSNLGARASKPIIEKDESGKIKTAFYHDDRMIQAFVKAFEGKGREVQVVRQPERKVPTPNFNFNLTLGRELRRLAVKMAVATADHVCMTSVLDDPGREFLLGQRPDLPRAIRDVTAYSSLDARRVPLSHLVYVEASNERRQVYGIVQFYGLFQLYVILNDKAYTGNSFAALGMLSPSDNYSETFNVLDPLHLPRPPIYNIYGPGTHVWEQRFNDEARQVCGDKAFRLSMRDVPDRGSIVSSTAQLTTFLNPVRKIVD